jgi:hypothetical protein
MADDPGPLEKLTIEQWKQAQAAALSKIRHATRQGDFHEAQADLGQAASTFGKDLPNARAQDQENRRRAEAERVEAERKKAEAEANKPFNLHMARATKKPTDAQIAAIEDAIEKKQYQKAIDITVTSYGIHVSNVRGRIRYVASYDDDGLTTKNGIVIGPSTFTHPDGGAARTAAVIIHEVTHANQIKHHGDPRDRPGPGGALDWAAYEAMAYQAEVQSAKELGLPSRSADVAYRRSMQEISDLGSDFNKHQLLVKGQYWDMKPGSP